MHLHLKIKGLHDAVEEPFFFFKWFHKVKSSHLYLYSAFNNTNCNKVTAQYQNRKIVSAILTLNFQLKAFHY